jgi:hypothetical protein
MTEEEPIGDFTYAAFRRLSTTIYVPRAAGEIRLGEIIETDPAGYPGFRAGPKNAQLIPP